MPARFITLANPSRRRRTVRRSIARRTHRNPSKRRTVTAVIRRPSPPKMTPAMRKKISIAVKAANRRRLANRSPIRRAVAAVSSYRRRPSGRRSGGGGSFGGSIKSVFSKPMLMKAGGAVGASLLTAIVTRKFAASLPGYSTSSYGKALYTLGIPVVGAYLLRKKAPALAEGMVIGGLVMAINDLFAAQLNQIVNTAVPQLPATTASYGVAGQLGTRRMASYPQSVKVAGTQIGQNGSFAPAW